MRTNWKYTVKGAISDRDRKFGGPSKFTKQEELLGVEALQDVYEALPEEIRQEIQHVDIFWKEAYMGCGYDLTFCFKGGKFGEEGWYIQSTHSIKTSDDKKIFVASVVLKMVDYLQLQIESKITELNHLGDIIKVIRARPGLQDGDYLRFHSVHP